MPNDTPTELGFQSFLVIEDDHLARNLLVRLLAGMGGVTLMKNLADRDYSGAVVLVSGADELTLLGAEGLAKYRGVNVLGYITKPVTKKSLAEFLESPGAGPAPGNTSR